MCKITSVFDAKLRFLAARKFFYSKLSHVVDVKSCMNFKFFSLTPCTFSLKLVSVFKVLK